MILICGPMGSGKTTYAMRKARETSGYVLDLDQMIGAMRGKEPHEEKKDPRVYFVLNDIVWVIAERLERLGKTVYVIRTAPGDEEMRRHGMACARIMLDTPKEICAARVMARQDGDQQTFEAAWGAWTRFRDAWGDSFRAIGND